MRKRFRRIFLIVMDSVGIGEAPDSQKYNDKGADTLGHIAEYVSELHIPNMQLLGLSNIRDLKGIQPVKNPMAFYTKMQEASVGKDTMTGHWEMMGLYIDTSFKTFPNGFPDEIIQKIEEKTGRGVIGNKPASGTKIIEELGKEHIENGSLIVYTSADSVFQIAAHEEIIPLEELYQICKFVRRLLNDSEYMVGRVIARPFVGKLGSFVRTSNRRDYALRPFGRTVMDELKDDGFDVIAIGKISDIFSGEGITKSFHTTDNMDGMDHLLKSMDLDFTGLSFLNLVDFDAKYGHRRNPEGYAKALEEYDARLPEVLEKLKEEDLLIITADHGNDPVHHGTDHTREYVPLLIYHKGVEKGKRIPIRKTFADIGKSIAENFNVEAPKYGKSFMDEILN